VLTLVNDGADGFAGVVNDVRQVRANGVGEHHVRHYAVAEESGGAVLGEVYELVDYHHVSRLDFLLHAPACADADYPSHPEFFHAPDIGAVVELGGRYPVAPAVARQEDHALAAELAGYEGVGRLPEGGGQFLFFDVFQPFQFVQSASSDYSDGFIAHIKSSRDF